MGDIYLKYRLKLKTGFFRSEVYTLMINVDLIKLVSEHGKDEEVVHINFTKIKTISISKGFSEEIEIRTDNDMYVGTFCKSEDISEAVKFFNIILGKRFIYN
jgi:hypothetical protein